MKPFCISLSIGSLLAGILSVTAAPITPTYDTFGELSDATFGGNGIPNDAVAITTYNGAQDKTVILGLTAHQRYSNPAVANDSAGTFYAVSGGDTLNGKPDYARWNFGWYVKNNLDSAVNIELLYDFDPADGTDEPALGKVVGQVNAGQTLQDSWNLGMDFLSTPAPPYVLPPTGYFFSPNDSGEYSFALVLRDSLGTELDRSAILVNAVPDGGVTAGLFGLGLLALTALRRFRWN